MNDLVDNFAHRLSLALSIRNMKPIELAEITKIDKSKISSYMSGRYKAKTDGLKIIADALNVSPIWLMGYDVPMEMESKTDLVGNPVTSIPILGVVKAGYDYLAEENWIGTIDINRDIVKDGKDYFALYVHGDSMLPDFKEGDIVLVKKQNDFENGQVVIALVNGDEATIKKAYKSNDGLLLQPINNAYQPLIFSKEDIEKIPVQIAGIVVQLQRKI